jgi:guanylate kinase
MVSPKILIVGFSGTGKTFFADKFEDQGKTIVKSFTTRPKREGEKDSNKIFTTQEHYHSFLADPTDPVVASTRFGKFDYWTIESIYNKGSVYVLDLQGLISLKKYYKTINRKRDFVVLELVVPANLRRDRLMKRGEDHYRLRDQIDHINYRDYGWILSDDFYSERVLTYFVTDQYDTQRLLDYFR